MGRLGVDLEPINPRDVNTMPIPPHRTLGERLEWHTAKHFARPLGRGVIVGSPKINTRQLAGVDE